VKANSWSFTVWNTWAIHRNSLPETRQDRRFPVPVDLLVIDDESLDYWLSRFVFEVRRQDCKPYPPNSLFNIVAGIQRFLRKERNYSVEFFSKSSVFHLLRQALDCRKKELIAKGIGVAVKKGCGCTTKYF